MNKKIIKIIISTIMIMILCLSDLLGIISFAVDNIEITKVTDEAKKKELLGFSDDEDLGILGIASKYSVFVKDDLIVNDADSEGKVAVGGSFIANTDYRYQTGCEYDNYSENSKEAKIVVGKGPIKNVATDFGWNNKTNSSYVSNKNVSVNTGFNYEESTYKDEEKNDVQYDLSTYKEANLFDFDEQFKYLNDVSQKLKGMTNAYRKDETATTTIKDYDGAAKVSLSEEVNKFTPRIIFQGNNEKINIFTVTVSEFNQIQFSRRDIIFDVPYGSYCVINIVGTEEVKFATYTHGRENGGKKGFYTTEIYYPISDEEIANNNMNEEDIGYISVVMDHDYIRDEEKNIKLFHRISPSEMCASERRNGQLEGFISRNVDINNPSSKYILWNLPDTTSFDLTASNFWVGSILAPNAEGKDTNTNCKSQISGTMMCKSYTGTVQFGYIPFDLSLADVNITVQDLSNTNIDGAELKLYDLKTNDDGELILNSKTLRQNYKITDESKNFTLATGGYILKEYNVPDGYKEVKNDNYQAFTVKNIYNYYGNGERAGTFSNTSIVQSGFTEKKSKIKEESSGPYSRIPWSWGELYNGFTGYLNGSDKTNNAQYRVHKITGKVNDTRTDKSEKLYYTISTFRPLGIGYLEIKQWTEVKNNELTFNMPLVNSVYGTEGVFITFYTGDGKKVTEGVSVSDVYAYWRKGTEGEISKTFTSKDLQTNISGATINILNEKIEKRETKITSKIYESIGDIFSLTNNKMTVSNTKILGTIKVTKTDIDNNYVQGVEFGLYKDNEDIPLQSKTTGEDGIVVFDNLSAGNYIVKEISVPDGYVLSKENQTVDITESKEYNLNYINKYTKLEIEKVDEYGNLLKDAYMQILDSKQNVIEDWITDENIHEINKKLKTEENYILREVKAPAGYEKAKDIEFSITAEGKILVNNEEIDKITVINKTLKEAIQTVEMIDYETKVEKTDENGKEDLITMVDNKQNIVKNEEKQDNSKTNLSMPKTGQSRLLYIAVVGIILVCIASLLGIRKDEENNKPKDQKISQKTVVTNKKETSNNKIKKESMAKKTTTVKKMNSNDSKKNK